MLIDVFLRVFVRTLTRPVILRKALHDRCPPPLAPRCNVLLWPLIGFLVCETLQHMGRVDLIVEVEGLRERRRPVEQSDHVAGVG